MINVCWYFNRCTTRPDTVWQSCVVLISPAQHAKKTPLLMTACKAAVQIILLRHPQCLQHCQWPAKHIHRHPDSRNFQRFLNTKQVISRTLPDALELYTQSCQQECLERHTAKGRVCMSKPVAFETGMQGQQSICPFPFHKHAGAFVTPLQLPRALAKPYATHMGVTLSHIDMHTTQLLLRGHSLRRPPHVMRAAVGAAAHPRSLRETLSVGCFLLADNPRQAHSSAVEPP
ncbi:hypothetical protein COO60DRAFT_1556728 [Scenedesmus sp. NREL 46B-D3]|nr:hypothetical protein COO60DRAFT_1556728 [Scenedesmus sp. NREL 46B-D3]